jgi:hypothetical protein
VSQNESGAGSTELERSAPSFFLTNPLALLLCSILAKLADIADELPAFLVRQRIAP